MTVGDSLTLLIGLLTAALSVVGAVVSVYYGHRLSQANRLAVADDLAVRFREPLLQSAHNLQSRLFNIVRKDFLSRFRTAQGATDAEREYSVVNTVYLFGQYLAWVEIVRRESQYLDPRSRESSRRDRRTARGRPGLRSRTATTYDDRCLGIFRGEQRADRRGDAAHGDDSAGPAAVGVPGLRRLRGEFRRPTSWTLVSRHSRRTSMRWRSRGA